MISLTELDQALPLHMRGRLNQETATHLSTVLTNEEEARIFRDNFISYTSVLKGETRFKLDDYINAVIYVGFKLAGYSDKDCYMRAFPDRYNELVKRGTSSKDIASYISAYNRGQLVNKILEQSLVPTWIINQDIYQKAINEQFVLMTTAKSEMVRQKAADSILNHLKRPDESKIKLSISTEDSDGIVDLKKQMQELAQHQKQAIEAGVKTQIITKQRLIDVTPAEKDS